MVMRNFENLNHVKDMVLRNSTLVEYQRGETICAAGGDKLAIRFISSGEAALYSQLVVGSEQICAPLARGSIINVIDLLEGTNQHTIKATSRSMVYEFGLDKFLQHQNDPDFLRWCIRVVTHNVKLLSLYTSLLLLRNADDRLLMFLRVTYLQQHGVLPQGEFSLDWGMPQQVFADMINVTRPYLNQRLKALTDAGVLTIEGTRYTVRTP